MTSRPYGVTLIALMFWLGAFGGVYVWFHSTELYEWFENARDSGAYEVEVSLIESGVALVMGSNWKDASVSFFEMSILLLVSALFFWLGLSLWLLKEKSRDGAIIVGILYIISLSLWTPVGIAMVWYFKQDSTRAVFSKDAQMRDIANIPSSNE